VIPHRGRILIVANTSWHVLNFRMPLIKELQAHGVTVTAAAPLDECSKSLEAQGVHHIELPIGRKTLNPLSDLLLTIRLYRLYHRERPDVVFHNTIKPVIYGSMAAHWAGVGRVLNMIPGLGYVFSGNQLSQRLLRPLVKQMYRHAMRNTDAVLFQNPDDRDYFVKSGLVKAGKSQVTYGSGVDLDHFYYVDHTPSNHCTFLLLGRMLWDKGVGEYVEAARRVRKRHPSTRFLLLGIIDPDNPSFIPEHVINEWNKNGDIEFLASTADVRGILEKADVVVLPSYYREGVPKSLLEAAAMGKPVITTDMPGCREAVVNNLTGLLIPARNVDALTEAMSALAADPARRLGMGREGRKLASERFDVKRVNQEILVAMGIANEGQQELSTGKG